MVGKTDNPFVGGQVFVLVFTQVERHTVHQLPESADVFGFALCIIASHGSPQNLFRTDGLVTGNVLIIVEVGGYRDVEHSLVGPFHRHNSVFGVGHGPFPFPLCHRRHASHEAHFAFQSFVLGSHAKQRGFVALALDNNIVVGSGEVGIERDAAPLVGREADGDHIVGQRSDHLAPIGHPICRPTGDGPCRVEAQFAVIVCVVAHARHGDVHVAESLVGHSPVGGRHHIGGRQVLRLLILPLPNQILNHGNGLQRLRIGIAVGLSGPNGFLVELYALRGRNTIYHGSKPAIAKWQSIRPHLCRFPIP